MNLESILPTANTAKPATQPPGNVIDEIAKNAPAADTAEVLQSAQTAAAERTAAPVTEANAIHEKPEASFEVAKASYQRAIQSFSKEDIANLQNSTTDNSKVAEAASETFQTMVEVHAKSHTLDRLLPKENQTAVAEIKGDAIHKKVMDSAPKYEFFVAEAFNKAAQKYLTGTKSEKPKAELIQSFIESAATENVSETILATASKNFLEVTLKESETAEAHMALMVHLNHEPTKKIEKDSALQSALEAFLPKGALDSLLSTAKEVETLGKETMDNLTAGIVTDLKRGNNEEAAKHAETINKSGLVKKAMPLVSKLLGIGGDVLSNISKELPKIVSEKHDEITNFLGQILNMVTGRVKANFKANPFMSAMLTFTEKPKD